MSCWRVFSSWEAIRRPGFKPWVGPELWTEHDSWPAARLNARQVACLAGVRYVSVQDPNDVVVGEYDRYTNRWREYAKGER